MFEPWLAVSAFSVSQEEKKGSYDAAYYFRLTINILAVAAQITGLVVWPATFYKDTKHIIIHPIALLLISCGWWENYFVATEKSGKQDNTTASSPLPASCHVPLLYLWHVSARLKRRKEVLRIVSPHFPVQITTHIPPPLLSAGHYVHIKADSDELRLC